MQANGDRLQWLHPFPIAFLSRSFWLRFLAEVSPWAALLGIVATLWFECFRLDQPWSDIAPLPSLWLSNETTHPTEYKSRPASKWYLAHSTDTPYPLSTALSASPSAQSSAMNCQPSLSSLQSSCKGLKCSPLVIQWFVERTCERYC
jgi:hypothetical protein